MADATVNVVNGQAVVRPFGSDMLAPLVSSTSASAALAQTWAEGTLPGGAGTYSAKEQALLADGSRKRAQNAVAWPTYAALSGATGMSAGDRATVQTTDTGTHTDPVVGGTVNNTGLYQYSASPAGWQRIDDLDSAKALVLAGTTTTSGTANPPVAGTSTTGSTLIDATAFGAAGVLQMSVYAAADGWAIPFTCSINGDGTVKLEQAGVPNKMTSGQVTTFTDFIPDVTATQYVGIVVDAAILSSSTVSGKTTWSMVGNILPSNLSSGSNAKTAVANTRMQIYWEVSNGQKGEQLKDIAARKASSFALGTTTASVGIIPASDGTAAFAGSLTIIRREPATYDGLVTAASVYTGTSGTGYFAVVERVGTQLVPRYIEAATRAIAAGANDFADLAMPIRRGQFVALYTTATVRYAASGAGVWYLSGAPAAVGTAFSQSYQATNTPRLGFTISPLVAGSKVQMDAGDAVNADLITGSAATFGATAADTTQGAGNLSIFGLAAVSKAGLITDVTFPAVAVSSGYILVGTRSGANWTTVQKYPVIIANGTNTFSGLTIPVEVGQFVGIYSSAANALRWQTGGGAGIDYLTGYNFSGTARLGTVPSVTFALQYTVRSGLTAKVDALGTRVTALESAGTGGSSTTLVFKPFEALGLTVTVGQVTAFGWDGQSNAVPYYAAGETSTPITTTQLFSNVMSNGSGGFTALVSATTEKNFVTAANFATVTGLRQGWLTDPATQWLSTYTAAVSGASIDPAAGKTIGAGSASATSFVSQASTLKSAATAASKTFSLPAVNFVQGETDMLNGMAKATYATHLENLRVALQTGVRGVTGNTDDLIMVMMQPCAYMRRAGASTGPVLAQFEASQTNPRYVLTGAPMYRMPMAADGVHLSNVGFKLQGAYFGKADAAILAGKKPQWLKPISALYSGSIIRVKFDVPVMPLLFDPTALGTTTNQGFRVLDNGATATISSLAIEGDTVVITCSASFTGPVKVRCALDYLGAGLNIDSGSSCTLRDSAPETITISGTSYQLFHAAPHFEMTAVNVGV